jgi:phosphoadenosine phosphosulfate reductase
MNITNIQNKLAEYKAEGKRVFATSSFQSHSIPMLHIISRIDKSVPVYFLNTGFLFPETIAFKDQIAEDFGLDIIGLESDTPKIHQLNDRGQLMYVTDPDYCCHLNKVKPLEPILMQYDIWINGIRADQNENRKNMGIEQPAPFGATRYHPMLNWSSKDIYQYIKEFNLPAHPLEKNGYLSIGCEPCTRKIPVGSDERNARWFGLNKTECGLHTELVKT